MAHFAKLDENNVVISINVVDNKDIQDLPFPESEPVGIAYLTQWSGGHTKWKQYSYNRNFRKNGAAIGGIYDEQRDAFIDQKPYPSWVLNEQTCQYESPVPKPESTDTVRYIWNEDTVSWEEIILG